MFLIFKQEENDFKSLISVCLPTAVFLLQEFIEEILSPPFGGMIAFVKEAEALLEKGQLERLKNEEGEVMSDGTSKRCVTRGGALFSLVTDEFGDFRVRARSPL